jgi:vacuolar-type H+-ATPase subunit E/Vma4
MKDKRALKAKIESVRQQLEHLDEKRSVLTSLLEKLQAQLYGPPRGVRIAESVTSYAVRGFTDKEVLIYDYVDNRIPMARRMFARRKKGFANLGYAIEHPSQGALAFD